MEPSIVPEATIEVGVMLSSVIEIAGVVESVSTIPLTPLAVVTDTEVTVPAQFISIFQIPSKSILLIVFIFVPDTRISCFAANSVTVFVGRFVILTQSMSLSLDTVRRLISLIII